MSQRKIYLAGKMRGIPELNHSLFFKAAEYLRKHGNEVFNPAEVDRMLGLIPGQGDTETPPDLHRKIMLKCCEYICEEATDIYLMMPSWTSSKGAVAEMYLCEALGLGITEIEVDKETGECQIVT